MISFSGVIRGSIAFALIQTLPEDAGSHDANMIIKSSVLFIVIVTTIVLGFAMPSFIDWQMKLMDNKKLELEEENEAQTLRIEEQKDMSITMQSRKSQIKQTQMESFYVTKPTYTKSNITWNKVDEYYFKHWFIYDWISRKKSLKSQ